MSSESNKVICLKIYSVYDIMSCLDKVFAFGTCLCHDIMGELPQEYTFTWRTPQRLQLRKY